MFEKGELLHFSTKERIFGKQKFKKILQDIEKKPVLLDKKYPAMFKNSWKSQIGYHKIRTLYLRDT